MIASLALKVMLRRADESYIVLMSARTPTENAFQ